MQRSKRRLLLYRFPASTPVGSETPKPVLRRGQGVRLSTDVPVENEAQAPVPAETQSGKVAETQKRRNAETQNSSQRINRGYALREDLVHELRLMAVNEGRKLYEVMEEALEQYLERRRNS